MNRRATQKSDSPNTVNASPVRKTRRRHKSGPRQYGQAMDRIDRVETAFSFARPVLQAHQLRPSRAPGPDQITTTGGPLGPLLEPCFRNGIDEWPIIPTPTAPMRAVAPGNVGGSFRLYKASIHLSSSVEGRSIPPDPGASKLVKHSGGLVRNVIIHPSRIPPLAQPPQTCRGYGEPIELDLREVEARSSSPRRQPRRIGQTRKSAPLTIKNKSAFR